MIDHLFTIQPGSITSPKGFKASGIPCRIKQSGPDLALIVSTAPCHVAAMYTTNKVPAPCILIDREKTAKGSAQAIIVNSGNANACTGARGMADANEMCELAAAELKINPDLVLVANTGIIGVPMPMDLIRKNISKSCAELSENGGMDAALAIMTTDLKSKNFTVSFKINDTICTIGAIAKGSGMINPNLATMICIVTTDVNIEQLLLRQALVDAVEDSLNMLTVDGEMSTNDCIFLFANGQSGNKKITQKGPEYDIFAAALLEITTAVTKSIAIDGEGATRLVTVTVGEAATKADAKLAAKSIANSNLVKTAIYGKDPNWGRVVQTIGSSGAQVDPNNFTIRFANISVAEKGAAIEYDKNAMKKALEEKEIQIYAGLGMGSDSADVFTCDLTHEYITINADYHT